MYYERLNNYIEDTYVTQITVDRIENYDGSEEAFKQLEEALFSLRYKIGDFVAERLFLEIAHVKGNMKYIEAWEHKSKQMISEFERICLENMEDISTMQRCASELDYPINVDYYLYLASVNVGNKAYVKFYIERRAECGYNYNSYEEIQEFLSDCQCNWEGDLEEYVWQRIKENPQNYFFAELLQDCLDKKLSRFNRNKNDFLKIQRFAAYNKDAYNQYQCSGHNRNIDRLTIEERLLEIAKKRRKTTFIKLHNAQKEGFIQALESMLSDSNAEINDIRNYVIESNRCFSADLEDIALRIAIRRGNKDYIKAAAPLFHLHVKQRYLQYLGETDDPDIRNYVSEFGLWVKDHFNDCDLVIEYSDNWGEVVHWDKNFLEEAYKECKGKGKNTYYFTDCMNLDRQANGRVKFNNWVPGDVVEVVDALNDANEKLYFEGHHTWWPFFEWQWEQDIHADTDERTGYLYILKKPNRHGHK
jgi:hypothetical protein